MNPPPSPPDPDDRWDQLVRRARADVAPSVDLAATLRALRTATPPRPSDWLADFAEIFATRHVLRVCLLGTAACTVVATWEAWTAWQVLPWVQLLAPTVGGVL